MKKRLWIAGLALAVGSLLSQPGNASAGGSGAGRQAAPSGSSGVACRAACWGGAAAAASFCTRIPNPVGQAVCAGASAAAASYCSDRCPSAPTPSRAPQK